MATRIAPSVDVSEEAVFGGGTGIWYLAQVREHTILGWDCIMGRGVYIGESAVMGDNYKVQNYALVHKPARLADGVSIGPAVTLTNDHFPRAVSPDGLLKSAVDWEPVGATIEQGASIGARAVYVAPVRIGAWATVAAGVVVTKDAPAHALIAGVPARRIGWVGRTGEPSTPSDPGPDSAPHWRRPVTGTLYEQFDVEPTAGSGLQSSSESITIREVTH